LNNKTTETPIWADIADRTRDHTRGLAPDRGALKNAILNLGIINGRSMASISRMGRTRTWSSDEKSEIK